MYNYRDDLISEATLALICHLGKIEDERLITACRKDMYKALAAFCRRNAPIRITGRNFREKLDNFQFVSLDSLEYCLTTPDDSVSAAVEWLDFVRTLEPDEQTALKMHMSGCTYIEILPHVRGRGKAYVCRLLQRVRRKAAMYYAGGDGS